MIEETPIVVVGGGLAGLTIACLLTQYDTKCIVLEKHLSSSLHPRAVGFTTRTMEIFSGIGIADKVPQTTGDFRLRRVQIESLAGKWGEELGKAPNTTGSSIEPSSPWLGAAIAQDKLEPLLRERAVELGCDLRMGHRMLSFDSQTAEDGKIKLTVRGSDGNEYTILTTYLVAADGHRSPIRNELGITTSGHGFLQTLKSVLFRAPSLNKYLESGFHQFQIRQPNGISGFMTTYNDSRWVLMFQDDTERTKEELGESIIQATGIPDLEYEILATGSWDLQARIASTFSFPAGEDAQPNIFLMGDAAHTLPPTRGGYGANTGIGDAHNLAWKLASVVGGKSTPDLLESYDDERRAVAWVRHNQTFAGPDYARYNTEGKDYGKLRDPLAVELGQVYESKTIISDEKNTDSIPITLTPKELKGRSGSRAPHVALVKSDGEKASSLDLWGKRWTLVADDQQWQTAVEKIAEELKVPVDVVHMPSDGLKEKNEGELMTAFGLQRDGASLIRPDGHVAWRCQSLADRDAVQELAGAVRQAACLVN